MKADSQIDQRNHRQNLGLNKTRENRANFVAFSVYDEILNGSLRPFFVDYLSDQEIKKVIDELSPESILGDCIDKSNYAKIDINKIIKDISEFDDKFYERDKNPFTYSPYREASELPLLASVMKGDDLYGKPSQNQQQKEESEELYRRRVESEIAKLIGADQEFHQSRKTEKFKELIQNEFKNIIQRIVDLKNNLFEEDKIRIAVNNDIEKAKKLASDANELSSHFKKEDPKWGYPNAFIVDMVKNSLINSIKLYQIHFGEYIDKQLISDDEFKALCDQSNPSWPIIKRIEEDQCCCANEHVETTTTEPNDVQALFDSKKNGNRFALKGDFWEISYGKNNTNIRNLERIRYIVRLLESPNKDFYCHELAALVKGDQPENCLPNLRGIDPIECDECSGEGQRKIHLVDPTENEISGNDLKACINVAMDLWQEANEINVPENELAKAKEDWEKAKKHFRNEYGLFFIETKKGGLRPKVLKRLNRDAEKSRTNVKKQISKAISDIAKKIPSFSIYLEKHIQTGIKCEFIPGSDDHKWTIDWGK